MKPIRRRRGSGLQSRIPARGAAIRDSSFRIASWSHSDERGARSRRYLRPLSLNQAPLMFTERRTAELIKYAPMRFSHQDHLHQRDRGSGRKGRRRCAGSRRGIGLDNRIGSKFLHAARLRRLLLSKGYRALVKIASIMTCRCGSSRPCWRSTTTASVRWRASLQCAAAACAARPSRARPDFKPDTTTCASAVDTLVTGCSTWRQGTRA